MSAGSTIHGYFCSHSQASAMSHQFRATLPTQCLAYQVGICHQPGRVAGATRFVAEANFPSRYLVSRIDHLLNRKALAVTQVVARASGRGLFGMGFIRTTGKSRPMS